MSSENDANLKNLMKVIPENGIALSSFLCAKGYSYEQLYGYKKRGWIDEVGHGAYCRQGQTPSVEAAVDALNHQSGLPIRIGSRSALALDGFVHFVPMREQKLSLYLKRGLTLPKWFSKYFAGKYLISGTSFLRTDAGISSRKTGQFECKMSDPERAILEFIELVPHGAKVNECYQLVEMMTSLRASVIQELLLHCTSVKVKRLFLMLAEGAGHPWFRRIDVSAVNLGAGCRMIDKGGELDAKYNVVVKPWREI